MHDRLRTYLGVCYVGSIVFVTIKTMSPPEVKAECAAAKKLFPPKKPPIKIDDWLMKKLE